MSAVNTQLGLVPNVFRVIGNSPAALEGYLGLNDAIGEGERLFHRPLGRRPDDHPGLSELGF